MTATQEPSAARSVQPVGRSPAGTRLSWAIWAWLAVAALFVVLALFAAFFDRFPADERIAHDVQAIDVPAFGGFLDFVNLLGITWVYAGLVIVLAFAFAAARAWAAGVLVLLTFVPLGLNNLLKGWIERPRPSPDLVQVHEDASGFAFPSGHAVGTAALFGLLFFLIPSVVPWRALRWTLQAGCLLIVIAAGPARIYVGAHWPSDVLGGYLLALLFLAPALMIYWTLRSRRTTPALRRRENENQRAPPTGQIIG